MKFALEFQYYLSIKPVLAFKCGDLIKRFSYMGGNVYVCEGCQSDGK